MIVFKAFLDVLKKYKGVVLLYTMILLVFGGINMATDSTNGAFVNTLPDIYIDYLDDSLITNNLISYMDKVANIKDVVNVDDALFYRDISYVIYIPSDYGKRVLDGEEVVLDVKSAGDYDASLAEMLLNRYLRVQDIMCDIYKDDDIIKNINKTLEETVQIDVTSKVDATKTSKMSLYYSFASYSIMAVVIYIICLVISSFRTSALDKRIRISSMKYRTINMQLLLASSLYAFVVFVLYNIFGLIILGDALLGVRGLIFILNSFIFTNVSLTIALLIANLINNKNAVNGIVNVVALGSSFLCGAFVPTELLPDSVLAFAHVLPTYYYIDSNNVLKTLEIIDFNTLKPVIINMGWMLIFALIFIVLNNIVTKLKRY